MSNPLYTLKPASLGLKSEIMISNPSDAANRKMGQAAWGPNQPVRVIDWCAYGTEYEDMQQPWTAVC